MNSKCTQRVITSFQVPLPPVSGPGRLVPILDQMIVDFIMGEERNRRRINEEFAAGTLQAEETARWDPVPEYQREEEEVPDYRPSPEL